MPRYIYQFLLSLTFLLTLPLFLLWSLKGGLEELKQRLGFYPHPEGYSPKKNIWLHAASVGEVQVAKALVNRIREFAPDCCIWVSTITRSGWQISKQQMPPGVKTVFAPIDLFWACSRAMRRVSPGLYICLETELWPELIYQAERNGAKPVLMNARISQKSLSRYLSWPARTLFSNTAAKFQAIAAISEDDLIRYQKLGVVAGKAKTCRNAKYDTITDKKRPQKDSWAQKISAIKQDRLWLVCGSTHPGEEEQLLSAFSELKRECDRFSLVLAPRHINRVRQIEKKLAQQTKAGSITRLSILEEQAGKAEYPLPPVAKGEEKTTDTKTKTDQLPQTTDIILVDLMGRLVDLYGLADYVFLGGSLVRKGGHNMFEAAAQGKPVFFGPYTYDFPAEASLLKELGGGFMVKNSTELARGIVRLKNNPELLEKSKKNATQAADELRGGADEQAAMIKELLRI